jgi:hypothetical protein
LFLDQNEPNVQGMKLIKKSIFGPNVQYYRTCT